VAQPVDQVGVTLDAAHDMRLEGAVVMRREAHTADTAQEAHVHLL
jgi:hypothetical protein